MTATEFSTPSDTPRRAGAPAAPDAPAVVYLLADHLDAVLARGEDLLATSWRPAKLARCASTIAEHQEGQRRAVEAVRTLELSLLSRALKARERARELGARDDRFAAMARLFAAFTGQLEDAAREVGDATLDDFETGDGMLAYLRSRGLVRADKATVDDCGTVVVTPQFRVARRVELGPLLDLVATFLDTLELHVELYPDPDANGPMPGPDIDGKADPAQAATDPASVAPAPVAAVTDAVTPAHETPVVPELSPPAALQERAAAELHQGTPRGGSSLVERIEAATGETSTGAPPR